MRQGDCFEIRAVQEETLPHDGERVTFVGLAEDGYLIARLAVSGEEITISRDEIYHREEWVAYTKMYTYILKQQGLA